MKARRADVKRPAATSAGRHGRAGQGGDGLGPWVLGLSKPRPKTSHGSAGAGKLLTFYPPRAKLSVRVVEVPPICGPLEDKIMQRPASVTVFGILNIVFAALGIFALLASVALLAAVGAVSDNPVVQIIQNNPAFATWMKISVVLGLVVSGALLAAGIGLLKLKPWARTISIAYAIYSIVMLPLGTVVNYVYLTKPLLEQAHQMQGPEAAGAVGGAIGGMFGGCFGLIYPVLLLIFMFRPNVVAAFRPAPAGAPIPLDDRQ